MARALSIRTTDSVVAMHPRPAYKKILTGSDTVSPSETPLVFVIGVGFVGTHLVHSFSSQYMVIGFDVSQSCIQHRREEFAGNHRVGFTTRQSDIRRATHILISVPTLLLPDRTVDSQYLQAALRTIEENARRGVTVIIESSVAIGMTRELLGPLAQSRGFLVGMSPERVDPGRTEPPMRSIPKVISGLDDLAPGSLSSIQRLYSKVFDTVVPVATPETAEMVKLYENCQRMMVIAYANEMADACYAHGIDPFEVCRAAATKPFGYLPTDPGLGVGGHCIPVNPYYLLSNNAFPLLQAAAEKMWARPPEIASRVLKRLMGSKSAYQEMKGVKRLLIVGIGFKKGQSHLVNSPSLALATQLAAHPTLEVMFADSLVRQKDVPHIKKLRERNWNRETFEIFDMIIVSHKPEGMDWELLVSLKGVQLELWCQGPEL